MTIPKIIHFCWFGKGKYSELISSCIESWNDKCSDYQIMLWNEDNFDVNSIQFTKEAYKMKKWAFVADYVRLYALYNYGGVYLDTDIYLLDNFDDYLHYDLLLGYTEDVYISTSFIAACKKNEWIKSIMDYYDNRRFIVNGRSDMKINPIVFTEISMKHYDFKIGDCQINNINSHIFSSEYFNPICRNILHKNQSAKEMLKNYIITENTKCVHLETATWIDSSRYKIAKYYILGIIRLLFLPIYLRIKKVIVKYKMCKNLSK